MPLGCFEWSRLCRDGGGTPCCKPETGLGVVPVPSQKSQSYLYAHTCALVVGRGQSNADHNCNLWPCHLLTLNALVYIGIFLADNALSHMGLQPKMRGAGQWEEERQRKRGKRVRLTSCLQGKDRFILACVRSGLVYEQLTAHYKDLAHHIYLATSPACYQCYIVVACMQKSMHMP